MQTCCFAIIIGFCRINLCVRAQQMHGPHPPVHGTFPTGCAGRLQHCFEMCKVEMALNSTVAMNVNSVIVVKL
jgi:hypothetical protein